MRPVVVVTHRLHDEVLAGLQSHCDVVANQTSQTLPRDEIIRRCKSADALMAFMPDRVDEAFLQACPQLRVIGAALKGYDNFDVEACARHEVCLTFVPDLLTVPTAELAIGLTIGLTRQIRDADKFVRSGEFKGWTPEFFGLGIEGSTIGLLGFGAIGQAIAERLSGWHCHLIYSDQQVQPEIMQRRFKILPVSSQQLFEVSDVVILGLPLQKDTIHVVNRSALRWMKKGAFLVNPCRGSVVDEQAIIEALESGRLGGYAADVFEMEDWAREDRPMAIDPALLNHPRTLFTAHIGSAVDKVRCAIEQRAADNILQALRGEVPQDAIQTMARPDRLHGDH
ncbi:phosphonate dehydrogenase [Allohahella sp. A8]|uniref:phosphonate dehydrogenase n=1 Tax=Allohahella sp. A8 TaxID=3141461 RepID=UPI003A7F6B4D